MNTTSNLFIASKQKEMRLLPAVLLFFLAPIFGEYLLGNLKFSELILVPFFAPLYGGGALLIREITRRAGHGYATMLTLGVAYALFEEGLVDQMLFNMNYFTGQAEISGTYIASLGIDVWLTIIVLAMHAIWSTCIPIYLVEALFPKYKTKPWLGRTGLTVTASVVIFGSGWLCYTVYLKENFFASVPQLTGTVVAIILLVAAAFTTGHRTGEKVAGPVPNPWIVGLFSLGASSLFMSIYMSNGWITVAACLLLVIVFFTLIYIWSHRNSWREMHRMAIVGGGILTYAWLGIFMEPETGPKALFDYIGSFIIACGAILLFIAAIGRLKKSEKLQSPDRNRKTNI